MAHRKLILSFDMETDIGSWTHEVCGITEGTPAILRVLRRHDVPATFLFTGREAQNNPASVESVLSDGHEVGCHTMYHETIGRPVYDVPVGSFSLDSEIESRLLLATDTIEKIAGVRPVSFRAPRLFGSTAMINCLERLGYLADSSFPAYYHGREFVPYHPLRDDWSRDGGLRIWEIPVFYDMDAQATDDKNRSRDQWPMLRLKGGEWFADLCRRMFARVLAGRDECVLCAYLHSWEFVEMPRKVTTDECTIAFEPFLYHKTGPAAVKALDDFLGMMRGDGVTFITMKAFANGSP